MRLPAHRLFFCLSAGFFNTGITLSTGVFKTLWISRYYLFDRWKVFKSVFHRLLKTHVDSRKKIVFFDENLRFFRFFTEILFKTAVFPRQYRPNFRISDASAFFQQLLENILQNTEVFQTRHRRIRTAQRSRNSGKRVFNFSEEMKNRLDSASEKSEKLKNGEIRSFFRKNGHFYRILHPFPATAKNSFPKDSTKIPEINRQKIFRLKRENRRSSANFCRRRRKNRYFSIEKPFFHKTHTPYYCYY